MLTKLAAKPSKRIIPIINIQEEAQYRSLYASQQKVYPRNVSGYFKQWRWAMIWLTQIVFYVTPWLTWNNRQSVLFDISAHQFYLFGMVLFITDCP